MSRNNNRKSSFDVEKLIANQKPTAEAVRKALEKRKAEEAEKQADSILNNLRKISDVEELYVSNVRNLRKAEKECIQRLKNLNVLKEKYIETADAAEFNESFRSGKFNTYLKLD